MTKPGEPFQWLLGHVDYKGDDCLIWPYSRRADGYGKCWCNNHPYRAHRLMCELAHGAPARSDLEAAHECGKGHLGCVNPNHLSWKTHSGNQRDRSRHGTTTPGGELHGSAKLTDAKVIAMRAEYRPRVVTYSMLAEKYGVAMQVAARAIQGQTWRHLNRSHQEALARHPAAAPGEERELR